MQTFSQIFPSATPESFQSFLGVSIATFETIQKYAFSLDAKHIMLVLSWLKCYNPVFASHFIWNYSERHYRRILWTTIKELYNKLPVITQNNSAIFGTKLFHQIRYVIDATECRIYKHNNWIIQGFFYSNKKKYHSLKYQIIVDAIHGKINNIYGPFCGSSHDTKVFNFWKTETNFALQMNEKLLGDKGYIGNLEIICPFKKPKNQDLPLNQYIFNKIIGKIRCIVEQTIGRMKHFKVLSSVWRHKLAQHQIVTKLIAKIVNISIETQPIRMVDNKGSKIFCI